MMTSPDPADGTSSPVGPPASAGSTPGSAPGPVPSPVRVVRKRSAKLQFSQTILVLEAVVVVFATLSAYALRLAPATVVWTVGGVLVLTLLVLSGMVHRPGGYVGGTLAQLAVVAGGLVVTMMFVVGGVFAVLWFVALGLGGRIDRERAEWDAAHPGQVSS